MRLQLSQASHVSALSELLVKSTTKELKRALEAAALAHTDEKSKVVMHTAATMLSTEISCAADEMVCVYGSSASCVAVPSPPPSPPPPPSSPPPSSPPPPAPSPPACPWQVDTWCSYNWMERNTEHKTFPGSADACYASCEAASNCYGVSYNINWGGSVGRDSNLRPSLPRNAPALLGGL